MYNGDIKELSREAGRKKRASREKKKYGDFLLIWRESNLETEIERQRQTNRSTDRYIGKEKEREREREREKRVRPRAVRGEIRKDGRV